MDVLWTSYFLPSKTEDTHPENNVVLILIPRWETCSKMAVVMVLATKDSENMMKF